MATRHNLPVNTPSDLLHSPGWCRWLPCNTGKAIFKLALLCDLIYLRDVRCTCSNRSKLLWVGRQQELARSPTSPGLARDDVLSEQAGHLSGVAWLGGTEGTSHSHISLHPFLLDREWIPGASCSEHIYRSAGQRCKEEMQDLLLHSHSSGVHSLLLLWFTWRAPCVPWGLTARITPDTEEPGIPRPVHPLGL